MTIPATTLLTDDHSTKHPWILVAAERAQEAATIPDGFEPLGLRALASRLRVSRMTAYRRMQEAAARQHRPDTLRVVRLPVTIGSGARRTALHVLWPVAPVSAAA